MKLFLTIIPVIATFLLANSAYAEICYEKRNVPASISCAQNKSNSADFTAGCTAIPAHMIDVEVPCTVTWVNWVKGLSTQEQVCATAGMVPTDFNGQTCASGENRPLDAEDINYTHGTFGPVTGGGDTLVPFSHYMRIGYDTVKYFGIYQLCYKHGQTRYVDGHGLPPNVIATAVACKPE